MNSKAAVPYLILFGEVSGLYSLCSESSPSRLTAAYQFLFVYMRVPGISDRWCMWLWKLTASSLHTCHQSFSAGWVETTGHSIRYADTVCSSKDGLIYPFIHAQVKPRLSATLDTNDDYKMWDRNQLQNEIQSSNLLTSEKIIILNNVKLTRNLLIGGYNQLRLHFKKLSPVREKKPKCRLILNFSYSSPIEAGGL